MNTSSRRAPVIAWAITAGVLYGGVGIVIPAPAGADDATAGPGAGTQTDASGAASASNASESRRHGRGTASAADDGKTEPGEHPCPWWPPRPLPKPMPFVPGSGGGNGGGFIAPVVVPTAPVAVFGDRVTPAAGTGTLPARLPDLTGLTALAPSPVAAGPAPAAVLPAAIARPARPIPRTIPRPPIAPAPISGPRVAVVAPAAPAPPAPERLGLPEVLREADVVTLLSRALPGLAAMFGMTALGGVLGYRQARAGYLLRAAGAGRFLR